MNRSILALLALSSLLLAGCTGPAATTDTVADVSPAALAGGSGSTGGAIANSPPVVRSFAADRTSGDNGGAFVVVFTGTVFDANTEAQLMDLRVATTGAATLALTHVVTAEEKTALDEPASFSADGFKVWSGERNDGVLHFRYRHAFPVWSPAGEYGFVLTARDAPDNTGASSPVKVTLAKFSAITVAGAPVDAAGLPQAGRNWGEWTARAGTPNVESTNHLKLLNEGDLASPRVVIGFSDRAFVGSQDANFSIPLAGNVQFAWWEGSATAAPSSGTFTWLPVSPDGTVAVQFTAKGNAIFVKYRIVQLPEVLPMQSYGASFTATEL